MDPDALLSEIRIRLAQLDRLNNGEEPLYMTSAEIQLEKAELAQDVAWLVTNLDRWISLGGFLPRVWQLARDQAARKGQVPNR